MIKRLLLYLICTSIPLFAYPQQEISEFGFRVSSKTIDVRRKPSYLILNDSIYQSRLIVNGEVTYQIDNNLSLKNLFFALSNNEDLVFRINVERLINYGGSISTPMGDFTIISNKLIIKPIETTDHIKASSVSSFHFLDISNFDKEYQLDRYGYLRWYFPTELLVNQDTAYDGYLSQWYNEERYYHDFGTYPPEGFIDSVKRVRFEERAENLVAWYSEQLILLNEPILCNGYAQEVFRFSWSNNAFFYKYNPYCMRIEPDDNGTAILFCSYNKYDLCEGYQSFCDIIPLDQKTFGLFVKLFEKMNFWNEKSMLDNGGSNCILEAFKDGHYHVVFRGKNENSVLEEIQGFLWDLLGFDENSIVKIQPKIER